MNYFEEIEEIVKNGFKSGQTAGMLRKIERIIKKNAKKKEILKFARKYVKLQEKNAEDIFLTKYTKDLILQEFEKIANGFGEGVQNAVRRGLKMGDSELAKKLVRRLENTAERHLATVVNTTKLRIAQGQVIEDALKAGIKKFLYAGPSWKARVFCGDHLNKVYTIEEILKMENGHGLPVIHYCGGWNCRHRWVPVVADEFLIEQQKENILK